MAVQVQFSHVVNADDDIGEFLANGVTAHRGNSGEFPENTLPAFKSGIEAGADWIELDIFRTKDGKLVDRWWFGCYGTPSILLVTDADFQMKGRYAFDCSLGIEGLSDVGQRSVREKQGLHGTCAGNVAGRDGRYIDKHMHTNLTVEID